MSNESIHQITIDAAPAYELVVSLQAFARGKGQPPQLPPDWYASVKKSLPPEFTRDLKAGSEAVRSPLALLLVWLCPEERTPSGFVQWLEAQKPGALYEQVAPYLGDNPLPDLGALRDHLVRLLTEWNERYFQQFDPGVLARMQADAREKQAWVGTMEPAALVERATNGVALALDPTCGERMLLVPQYHFSPANVIVHLQRLRIVLYGADVSQAEPGHPPARLMRLARAFADESRLRILRFVAEQPRTFLEVVQFSGLAQSTVHHHLVAMRAAGLLRLTEAGREGRYSVRLEAIEDLQVQLRAFLSGG